MKKKIFVFLLDGFSDLKISYLTPELNKSEQFDLVYFSKNENLISSMGGLQIRPTKLLLELKSNDLEMLILPGGTAWEKDENEEMVTIILYEIIILNKPVSIYKMIAKNESYKMSYN